MTAFKPFNTNQVVITPFFANKNFQLDGNQATASDIGVEYYQSRQGSYLSGSFPTGFTTRLDEVLVFNSIKQLYYSNYLTSSTGDSISTQSLVPGAIPEYNSYTGVTTGPRFDNFLQSSITQNREFTQYSASTNIIGPSVISIPSKLFGEKIPCSTFNLTYTSSLNQTRSFVYDDSEGNLITTQSDAAGNIIYTGSVGQIFYSQGIAVLTGPDSGSLTTLGNQVVGAGGVSTTNFESCSLSFSSSITIRENQYKCVVRDNEYSYTLNPSVLVPYGTLISLPGFYNNKWIPSPSNPYPNPNIPSSYVPPGIYPNLQDTVGGPVLDNKGSGGTFTVTFGVGGVIENIEVTNVGVGYVVGDRIIINTNSIGGSGYFEFDLSADDITSPSVSDLNETYANFATGSYFSPYVTTIGLYNESFQLVAVGKLAQPIPISLYVDTTFVINFDT